MKLNNKFKKELEIAFKGKIKSHLPHERGGVYEMNIDGEITHFIAIPKKQVRDCNFTELIYKHQEMFKNLVKINGYKKVLFIVGNSFHWLSI